MKKIISAVLALCLVGGTMPFIENYSHDSSFTVYAEDYTEVTEGDLTYAVYSDHAEVVKCNINAEDEITIASKINNVPVTIICDKAFQNCQLITSMVIPETITCIGSYSFYQCLNLKNINLPNVLTEIGEQAFANSGIESLILPEGIKIIFRYTFSNCKNLTSVSLPNTLRIINDFSFFNCSNLKSIVIPDSIVSIGNNAFSGCPLESVTVPEDFKNIVTTTTKTYYTTTYYRIQTTLARPTTGKPTTTATTQPVTTHPLGDVNGDDIVDGRDATAILTYYAKTSTGYTGTLEDFIKSQPE